MVPDDPEVAELLDMQGTSAVIPDELLDDPEAITRALLEQHRRDVMG